MPYEDSQSFSGQGTKIEFWPWDESPIVYRDIGELMSFTPSGRQELSDPTNLLSTGREKVPALYDPGSVKSSVNRTPGNAAQTLLQSAYMNQTLLGVRVTLAPNLRVGQTTGDVYVYTAYVVQNEPDVQVAKHIVNQFELALKRFVSFTQGTIPG